jgi:Haem-binding uptake, Tiki superfamily, ChaN
VKTSISLPCALVFLCAFPGVAASAQPTPPSQPAAPVEPAAAIAEAFRTYPLVAIGDNHGNNQVHEFRLALIRDPRLAGVLRDIVVEFGNARYQDVMDRFVQGEAVTDADLRRVWQDTTQVEEAWDLPIYEEFFRAVRTANASRRPSERLRVLLGDPPIDWDAVHSAEDLGKWGDRDAHAVEVIRREVLSRGRRGLVIYGDQHLVRRNIVMGAPDDWAHGIVARLEKDGVARVFSIHVDTRLDMAATQPDITTWRRPTLATLSGTSLGRTVMEPGPNRKPVQMQEQFDAILYLGSPAAMTTAQLAPALCADPSYVSMRSNRLQLLPAPADAPFNPADRLKARCAFPRGGGDVVDRDPAFTNLVRATLIDAQKGQAAPERFAPALRARLVRFVERYGPRILGPMGELKSLTLIGDATVVGQHLRRYRAEFANGRNIWTIGVSPENTISSMDPMRN